MLQPFLPQLPPSVQALLQSLLTQIQTPLSQLFDSNWSQPPPNMPTAQTQRDKATATIISTVHSQYQSAYNISASLPMTGTLRAVVLPNSDPGSDYHQYIWLSYELKGISVQFTLPANQAGLFGAAASFLAGLPLIGLVLSAVSGPAQVNVTLDFEVLLGIGVPTVSNTFTVTSSPFVQNANISPGNFTATVLDALGSVINFLQGQPPPTQAPEGELDASGSSFPVDTSSIATMLNQLQEAWLAAQPLGFITPFSAFVDGNARTLNLRLRHPVDPAPSVSNAAVQPYPSFLQATIAPSFPQVQVDRTLTITGSNFPLGQANSLYIGWYDTTSGDITESDVMWGQAGGQLSTLTITRTPNDGKNFQVFPNLPPNTTYVFTVQDQDLLTETGFGPTLPITTQSSNDVDLVLTGAGWAQNKTVGHVLLDSTGTFNVPIDLTGVPVGTYTVTAMQFGNPLAQTAITVVQTLGPTLYMPHNDFYAGTTVAVDGTGFEPGTVELFVDSASGQPLAKIDTTDGTFHAALEWPVDYKLGQHNILGQEVVGGNTVSAPPVSVDVHPLQ